MRSRWQLAIPVIAAIGLLLAINTLTVSQETEQARPDGGRIVSLPDGAIHVREDGRRTNPPVVLIHGWASSLHWWDRITPLLARRYRVIRIDLRGHGNSAKPEDGYTVPEQASAVGQAIAAFGVRRALVVGHSLGGKVAINLASRSRQLARRLVVIDTGTDSDQVDTDFAARLSMWPVLGQLFWRFGTDGQVRGGLEQAFAEGFEVPERFVSDFRKMTYNSYKKSFDRSEDYTDNGALERDFKRSRQPAMIVFGSQDRLVDPAAAREYPKLRSARVELVDGAGHSPMVEKPADTARLLIDFDRSGSR